MHFACRVALSGLNTLETKLIYASPYRNSGAWEKWNHHFDSRGTASCRQQPLILVLFLSKDESAGEPQSRLVVFVVWIKAVGIRPEVAVDDIFVLENQVGEVVAKVDGTHSDGSSGKDIGGPMPVVEYSRNSDNRRYRVSSDAEPGTSPSVLLVQHCRCEKGCCGVPGGEGIPGRTVWPQSFDGILDCIDYSGHQGC